MLPLVSGFLANLSWFSFYIHNFPQSSVIVATVVHQLVHGSLKLTYLLLAFDGPMVRCHLTADLQRLFYMD